MNAEIQSWVLCSPFHETTVFTEKDLALVLRFLDDFISPSFSAYRWSAWKE